MRFAWQAFSFDQPDNVYPVSLTGNFSSGYAGLSSSQGCSIQIRWQRSKLEPNRNVLDTYLKRLNRDAEKRQKNFDSRVWDDEDGIRFEHADGEGALLTRSGRLFFLEISATSKRARTSTAKQVFCSFKAENNELLPWRILGLEILVPKELTLQRKELLAGKTTLHFGAPLTRVRAERWGAADQLLANTSLTRWLDALLGANGATEEGPNRASLAFHSALKTPVHARATWQVEQNQITLLRSTTRQEKMRPQWDWFD